LTPETDALTAADQHHLEDDNFFPATVYWRMGDLARKLERERDKYQDQADALVIQLGATQERMIDAERERDEWRKKAVGVHKMEVAIHYALMHLETNYDIDGASMKDSDAARKLRSAISLENDHVDLPPRSGSSSKQDASGG
jgi:threonine synthase